MKLYYAPGLCSMAPHIALREADLSFNLEKVNLESKVTESGQNYFAINPHGYVPALEIEPGIVLTEGPAIMQYIADSAPASNLAAPLGTLERYRLQSWLNYITSEIHKAFSSLFNAKMPAEAKTVFKEQLAKRLDYVDAYLSKQDYLMDSRFSIADAYLFVVIGWHSFVGIDLQEWPALVAYRERIGARPAVRAALAAEG